MFKGMKTAIEVYEQMKTEIHSLHAGILAMKTEMNDLKDQHAAAEAIAAQDTEERCRSANANYDTALIEIARIEALVHTKDTAIRQYEAENKSLRDTLKEAENLIVKANESELGLQSKLDATQSKLQATEQRHDTLQAELTAARTRSMQLTSQPGAPFYDHNTRMAIVCPVLQSNGYIVPFKTVLAKWMEAAGPEDGYIHRTYICPVMQQPTTLASLATQDRIRHIAKHAGINIDPPLVFSYMSDGVWTSFSFHDQLNIIAKVCAVQTMQITECVEQIVVQRNTMAIEINAAFSPVTAPAHSHIAHTINALFRQEGTIRIKCAAENLSTHAKYYVKATPSTSQDDWNPTGLIQFE